MLDTESVRHAQQSTDCCSLRYRRLIYMHGNLLPKYQPDMPFRRARCRFCYALPQAFSRVHKVRSSSMLHSKLTNSDCAANRKLVPIEVSLCNFDAWMQVFSYSLGIIAAFTPPFSVLFSFLSVCFLSVDWKCEIRFHIYVSEFYDCMRDRWFWPECHAIFFSLSLYSIHVLSFKTGWFCGRECKRKFDWREEWIKIANIIRFILYVSFEASE